MERKKVMAFYTNTLSQVHVSCGCTVDIYKTISQNHVTDCCKQCMQFLCSRKAITLSCHIYTRKSIHHNGTWKPVCRARRANIANTMCQHKGYFSYFTFIFTSCSLISKKYCSRTLATNQLEWYCTSRRAFASAWL